MRNYREEIWVRNGGWNPLISTMVHKSTTLEILRNEKWPTSQVKKAWEWVRSQVHKKWGPLSFRWGESNGRESFKALLGVHHMKRKKGGEKKKKTWAPSLTLFLLQVSFKHEQEEEEVWNMKAVEMGCINNKVFLSIFCYFFPQRSCWIWWGVCVVGPMFWRNNPPAALLIFSPSKEGTIKEVLSLLGSY